MPTDTTPLPARHARQPHHRRAPGHGALDDALFALFIVMMGLLAGFFFAWSNPAMMGFARTTPATYVEAMQQINLRVRNPWFGALFFGVLPVAALALWRSRAPLMAVAAACALAGFAITVLGNVPMNDAMAGWSLDALPPADQIAAFRARWDALNLTRMAIVTAGMVAALAWVMRR